MSKPKKVRAFRLSDSVFESIQEIAKAKHVSNADVIACLVSAYEKNGEQMTFYEGAVDNDKLEHYFDAAAKM